MTQNKTAQGGGLWRAASVGIVVILGACTPRVEVAAPDKPITINLNVKIVVPTCIYHVPAYWDANICDK